VQLFTCNGTGAQVWFTTFDGELINPESNRCLDASNTPTAGTQLVITDCTTSNPSEVWADYFTDADGSQGFEADAQQLDSSLWLGMSTSKLHIPTVTQTAARNAAITPGSGSSAGGQVFSATMVTDTDDLTQTYLPVSNSYRWTETQTTYNSYDLATMVKDLGDLSTSADDTCTTTTYV